MDPSRQLIIVLSFSYILLHLSSVIAVAQPDFMHYWCRMDVGNYTTNSTYQRNLNSLLSSFASNTQVDYGFYNLSLGQTAGPDQVNGLAICGGDVELHDCRGCVINSTRKILQVCPYQKDAIGVYDLCILRYSNRSILGVVEELPAFYIRSSQNASDVNEFNQALGSLMNRLRSSAASGNSLRKFATGSDMAGFTTIFGRVQCTPDLSDQQCNNCLVGAIGQIVGGMVSARITKPSCSLQYDNWRFFGPTVPLTAPSSPPMSPQAPSVPPTPTTEGKKSNKTRIILIIVVPVLVSVVVLIISIWVGLRAQTETKGAGEEDVDEIDSPESLQFAFDTIKVATDNFSEHNMLGQGGFGPVYKGTLSNGQKIAVKRLSKGSVQGDLEFKNEVLLVAKLHHRNLVRLLGFCLQGIERLLIYEFFPNASLDKFIYDPSRRMLLYWGTRYKIICGIARGLLYLHEDSRLRIIHRDLKASNILLDPEMNPKISDFGTARLFVVDQSQDRTSRIVGTYGYMAPEYAMQGQISVKSDVFSFGVLVLEIVCGKKNSSRCGDNVEHLLSYAWRRWREGTALDLIDPILRTNGSTTEMMRCIQIGLLCVQEHVADRPNMASVVLMLSSNSESLPLSSQPAFFMGSRNDQSEISSSLGYNSRARTLHSLQSAESEAVPLSQNEASISELYPR